ncbi:MAG: ArsR family transcriptional regulator [Rhodospirillales bacterium]|nr:ArsR family transcriptional regulator [Rhodospirillales bacterium]
MSFPEVLAEDRRLVVLRSLEEASGYSLNEGALRRVLDHFGHRVGRDVLRADLAWLREHGLVAIEEIEGAGGALWIGKLTQGGLDVAQGRLHPGIARRGP